MKKFIFSTFLASLLCLSATLFAQENETICSQRNDFCFQIPPNYFMLTTNDIESSQVGYKTVDGSSTIEIVNGSLSETTDFHKLYLLTLGQWTASNYRLTLKKEYNDFFIVSGYTSQGRGFYQKVIKIENDYASAYLEFPKGNKKYSNVSQMLFDYFQKTVID
jgi:hypothetical protein